MRNRFKLASFAPFCDQNRPKRKLDNLRILLPDSFLKRSDFQTEFEFPFSSFARSFFSLHARPVTLAHTREIYAPSSANQWRCLPCKNVFVQTLTSPGQSKFAFSDLVHGEFAPNIALSYCGKMVAWNSRTTHRSWFPDTRKFWLTGRNECLHKNIFAGEAASLIRTWWRVNLARYVPR